MKYLGSKNKLAKDLVPVIQNYITEDIKYYVEPFVGGANLIDKINFENKLGSDIHPYLIALLNYAQNLDNRLPSEISEEEYQAVKNNKDDYPDWYVGLVGFCATFGSKWFGGYARSFKADGVTPRNMSNEAIRNLERQRPSLKNTKFICTPYDKITNISNALVYCDIPYRKTTGYGTEEFDYEAFYQWCVDISKQGNTVLISEYSMPEDRFEVVWEKEHKTIVSKQVESRGTRIERLFKVKEAI